MISKNPKSQTWVAFGDSITEGMTYPLWLTQSLVAAGRPAPYWVNAGVGGHTAGQMLERMDRDVLAHDPDFVFFNAGVNDLLRHKNQGAIFDFRENVELVLQTLGKAGIRACVNSTYALAGPMASHNADLKEMNAYLRQKAGEHGFQFANIFDPFLAGLERGDALTEDDHVHLSEKGYEVYVTALLEAIAPGVRISKPWQPWLEPGLIAAWKITSDDGQVLEVQVPEAGSTGFWWTDQERKRGYVLDLRKRMPGAQTFTAQGTLHLDSGQRMLLKVGGQVEGLKVDEKELPLYPTSQRWGTHDAAHLNLDAGDHAIELVVSDSAFFFSAVPASPLR